MIYALKYTDNMPEWKAGYARRERFLLIIVLSLLLTGCLVCRHTVLAHYGWAVEEGFKPKIALYTTTAATRIASLGIWNGHVQAKVGDKWVYGDPPRAT